MHWSVLPYYTKPWKDERGPSSITWTLELFQRQHWKNFWETGWSSNGLFPSAQIPSWTELTWTEQSVLFNLVCALIYFQNAGGHLCFRHLSQACLSHFFLQNSIIFFLLRWKILKNGSKERFCNRQDKTMHIVADAFFLSLGYRFDQKGKIVHSSPQFLLTFAAAEQRALSYLCSWQPPIRDPLHRKKKDEGHTTETSSDLRSETEGGPCFIPQKVGSLQPALRTLGSW